MIGFSDGSYTLLVVGRLLQGFGIMSSISQIYMVEISDIKRRFEFTNDNVFMFYLLL